jgi:tRNA G18 (ribose-2'-O)-methylase SpoU
MPQPSSGHDERPKEPSAPLDKPPSFIDDKPPSFIDDSCEADGVPHAPKDSSVVTPGPLIALDVPEDPRLDLYRNLNDPAGRIRLDADHSVFVVEGRLAVQRLVTSRYTVRSLLVDDHQVAAVSELVAAVRARGVPVFVGSREVVASTVGFNFHRGVVAVADRPTPAGAERLLADAVGTSTPRGNPRVIAILEGINDSENIGSLFRNAAAFGVSGVLLDPTCADPLYRRSVRVSVGHVLRVPFARLETWPNGLELVRAAGFIVAAMGPRVSIGSGVPIHSLAELRARTSNSVHHGGVALVLGAEGNGLTAAALAASDVRVSIPMSDGIDSLNVATAAAVAFYALTCP